MALINDPRAFTGGAAVFNTTAPVNTYMQLAARKQAKEDALNQYFTDLQTKINTAGVRVQDLDDPKFGGINKDIEAWRSNWLQNKDAIKKGGMAQQQHMSQFQEILRKINQSKQRAKTELEIGKAKFEGKYNPDEDDIGILSQIGKSIYDPTSYKQDGVSEYGWGDLSPNLPAFDEKKFVEGITFGMKPSKQYGQPGEYDPKTGLRIMPFELKYKPEEIQKITESAARRVGQDRTLRRYANQILDNPNSDEYRALNQAYQSIYRPKQFVQPDGQVIVQEDIVDTPEKVARALAILRTQGSFGGGEEKVIDREEMLKRQQALKRTPGARTGGAANIPGRIDLTDYRDVDNKKDITELLQGVKVTGLPSGQSLLAEKVLYDPAKKEFTITEYASRDENGKIIGGKTKVVPYVKFMQDIKTMNPQMDMKYLEGLSDPITQKPTQPKQPKKDPLGLGL